MSEPEAVKLFLSHYTIGKIPPEEVKELVRTVDLHTLTIEILAKTAQTQRTGIGILKRAIKDDLKTHVYVAHRGNKIEKVTSYLSSIFTLCKLTGNEMWLLRQFACLPPEFHPYDLLTALIAPEAANKDDIFSETMEALSATGWLLKHQATNSCKMHRIIADATNGCWQCHDSMPTFKRYLKSRFIMN